MSDTPIVPNDGRPDLVPGGQTDDPGELRTDDFGLGGDMRQQLMDALAKRWNPNDPGATTLDDQPAEDAQPSDASSSADTAASPAPAPDAPPAPSTQGQPSGEGDGGGRAAEPADAAASDGDGSQPPAPTPEQFNAGQYLADYFGTNLTREQAQAVAATIGGLQALSPQQREQLDRVLASGEVGQYPATQGVPAQPQMQPTAAAPQTIADPAVDVLGPRPDDDYAAQQWDLTATAVRAQAQQLAELQANIAETTRVQQQQQVAATQARIDQTVDSWRAEHTDLSDAEFDGLKARAEQSGTFPALVAAHHGDIDRATTALLEQTFWSDPALRDRAIANIMSGRTPGDRSVTDPASGVAQGQAQTDTGRQALASSVAGGGGSITPQSSAPPRDPDQRKAAMVQEIASQHDFAT